MTRVAPFPSRRPARQAQRRPAAQRGVVMLFALIALVIMLVGSVAVMRSLNVSLFNVGNIAFKRDMSNQAERVLGTVLTALKEGDLATAAARAAHSTADNYSASILETNTQGIPVALLADDDAFAAVGNPANDIEVDDQNVRIRYVIDRLCDDIGEDAVLGSARCVLSESDAPAGGDSSKFNDAAMGGSSGSAKGAAPLQVGYRVSIRVSGPRNTLSFFQTPLSR